MILALILVLAITALVCWQLWGEWRWLVFLLAMVVVILMLVSRAHAQEAPRDVIEPLKKGQAAPFEGQLFDTPTALRWGMLLKNYQERPLLERKKEQDICVAKLAYKDDILQVQMEKDDALINDLKMRMLRSDSARVKLQQALDHPPWYTSIWFGIGVGVISTTALVIVGHQAF